jgi:hypothetical protein
LLFDLLVHQQQHLHWLWQHSSLFDEISPNVTFILKEGVPYRGERRPTHSMHARAQSYQQEKGKGLSIDQDDFQQIQFFLTKKHAKIYFVSLLMNKGSKNLSRWRMHYGQLLANHAKQNKKMAAPKQ